MKFFLWALLAAFVMFLLASPPNLSGTTQTRAVSVSGCPALTTPESEPGMIRTLQQSLRSAGYTLDVDGAWGTSTSQSLKTFQREQGLRIDGVAGSDTWKALGRCD